MCIVDDNCDELVGSTIHLYGYYGDVLVRHFQQPWDSHWCTRDKVHVNKRGQEREKLTIQYSPLAILSSMHRHKLLYKTI